MELLQLDRTVIKKGFSRPYRLFQLSDAHLACTDDHSTPEDTVLARELTAHWMTIKRDFAALYHEFCDERYDTDPCVLLKALMDHAAASGAEALLISGDLMERVTDSCIRYLRGVFDAYPLPILFCPGNHCYANAQGEKQNLYSCLRTLIPDPEFQTLDMGEFRIIAVDDAMRAVSDRVLSLLRTALEDPRPILLMCHIPLRMGEYDRLIGDTLDPYFFLNGETDGENAAAFLHLVEENAHRFIAVLAGHVHGTLEHPIAPGLIQYTTSSALIGKGREIVIC